MSEIGRAVTIALAILGGSALFVLFRVFIVSSHDLFKRVDKLEEVVRKHGLAIRGMKKNGSSD